MLLPGQGSLAAGKYLVLERLELAGDVTFGCFQSLFAGVDWRHQVLVTVRDLDVIAVNAVVAHFQAGNSGLLTLLLLVLHKEIIGVC